MASDLNARAEAHALAPWESYGDTGKMGYYSLPQSLEASLTYQDQGFLVVENAFSPEEIENLKQEAIKICRGQLGQIQGVQPNQEGDTDDQVMERYLCLHFPHKISPLIRDFISHPNLVQTLTQIIGPDVKCMQSMLFIKSSGKPGQAWHQDEIYIPTRDRSLTGGWIALDDATVENGCLWVIPGSHKRGILYFQEWHADPRFDCSLEARGFPWTDADAVPVEVKAGSVVYFNGYLLHRSLPNYATGGYRRALVNHYMSATSLLPWGWDSGSVTDPVAQFDVRDVVVVAGKDPYAFKGYPDLHGAHIRPSGKGGCGNNEYNQKS